MSSSARQTTREAGALVESSGGLIPFVRQFGFGGISYALILAIVDAITSLGGVLLAPWQALGDGLAVLVEGTVGGAVVMVEASLMAGVRSFQGGLGDLFGPLAFPIAIASVMLGIYVFMLGISRIGFSPLAFVRNVRG